MGLLPGWTLGDGERTGTGFRVGGWKFLQPPFTKEGQRGSFRLLVGLAYGELGTLEGAFAVFERLGEIQNLFVGLGV